VGFRAFAEWLLKTPLGAVRVHRQVRCPAELFGATLIRMAMFV
jgi:hypothetical protein